MVASENKIIDAQGWKLTGIGLMTNFACLTTFNTFFHVFFPFTQAEIIQVEMN